MRRQDCICGISAPPLRLSREGDYPCYWAEQVEEELAALGVAADAVAGIVAATQAASLPELEARLGPGHEVHFFSPEKACSFCACLWHC